MRASVASVIAVATTIIQGANSLLQFSKDASKHYELLKKLFKHEGITEDELVDIRKANDALNAEIESQTEAGQG